MMDTTLVMMFRHNKWANLRLLDFCTNLEEELLDAAEEGTYGRVRDTLLHLLAAEGRYVGLFTDVAPERLLRESQGFPGIDVLREHAERSGDALIEIAARDPYEEILNPTYRGDLVDLPAVIPLIQAIHHGNDHRSQIVTILSRQGVEPPDLSGWAYNDTL